MKDFINRLQKTTRKISDQKTLWVILGAMCGNMVLLGGCLLFFRRSSLVRFCPGRPGSWRYNFCWWNPVLAANISEYSLRRNRQNRH